MSKYVNEVAKLAYGYAILHEAIEENKNSAAKTAAIGAGAGIAGGMLSQTQGFKNFTANAANGMRRMMQPPQGQPGQVQQSQTASAQSGVNAAVASGNVGVTGGANKNPHNDILNQNQTTTTPNQTTNATASVAQTPAPQQSTNTTPQTPLQGQAVGGNTQPQVAQPAQTQTPTVPTSTPANQAASTAVPSGSNVPVDDGYEYGTYVNGKFVPISRDQYDKLTTGDDFNVDLPASMQAQYDRVRQFGPSVNNALVQQDINAGTFTDPNDPKYLNQIDREVNDAHTQDEINDFSQNGIKLPSLAPNYNGLTSDSDTSSSSETSNGELPSLVPNLSGLTPGETYNGATVDEYGRFIAPSPNSIFKSSADVKSTMSDLLQQDNSAVQQAYNNMGRLGWLGNKFGVYNPAYNVRTNFNFGNSSDTSASSSAAADAASYNP